MTGTLDVAPGNSGQAAAWDGREGEVWATYAELFERSVAAYDPALFETAAIGPHDCVLDVGCGTGFLTRHLRGIVVGLDQSPPMVALAQRRLPAGIAVRGDALALPFADAAFDRLLTAHV